MGVSLKKYYFGKSKMTGLNTFIGGIGATMNTPALLAVALGITADRISMFSVVNNNIECAIKGTYSIDAANTVEYNKFRYSSTLTYFYDMQGLCINLGFACFANVTSSKLHLYFPGIISQTQGSVFASTFVDMTIELPNCIALPNGFTTAFLGGKIGKLIIPKCTSIGSSKLDNGVFQPSVKANLTIYAPISEQTSNAGGVEGDLATHISGGGTVIFVPNYTAPNQITNLTAVTQSATSVKLNFTAPTSTNTISFYEVYANGLYFGKVTASGQDVTGLTSGVAYKFKLKAVDIYYNKSVYSNEATPSAITVVPYDILMRWEDNANDVNGLVGTVYNSDFVTGVVGKAIKYKNLSSSYATLPDTSLLSFNNGINDTPASVWAWVNWTGANGTSHVIAKRDASGAEWQITREISGNKLAFTKFSNNNVAIFTRYECVYTPTLLSSDLLMFVTDGVDMTIRINNVPQVVTKIVTGAYVKMQDTTSLIYFGKTPLSGSFNMNGYMDETGFANEALSAALQTYIYDTNLAGASIQ